MSSASLSSTLSLYTNVIDNKKPYLQLRALALARPPPSRSHSSLSYNPLRSLIDSNGRIVKSKRSIGSNAVSYPAPISVDNLRWISTISSVVLLLARGTAVPKQFIVPLFALQAPASVVTWIKGTYGVWAAFLALLVRLFFFIPGELELPLVALLLVMVAPYDVMKLRGTQQGAIISLLIAGYLAFQHFSRASLQKAFDQAVRIFLLPTLFSTKQDVDERKN
ncbi:hypothetical protein L6164_031798 [Bauhinia variegata]|uniref:Uncharacterized protein n=1 Tax=Bauhinia variegata TaxID=167791 RepID=A0ACB9KLU3_BAUVA|nr:hypothetical protein L6164_031798 [Bauhinia variegata]